MDVKGAKIETAAGSTAVSAASRVTAQQVNLEVAIPWAALDLPGQSGDMLGFDLFWSDADHENSKRVAGSLRWAGGSRTSGYLMLSEQKLQ